MSPHHPVTWLRHGSPVGVDSKRSNPDADIGAYLARYLPLLTSPNEYGHLLRDFPDMIVFVLIAIPLPEDDPSHNSSMIPSVLCYILPRPGQSRAALKLP